VALEVGEFQKAVEYARAALLMDLADVGGNVTDVCHIASHGRNLDDLHLRLRGFFAIAMEGFLSGRSGQSHRRPCALHSPTTDKS
jgi:trehalose/maltose hydrolase-like predicted phosphorylase